MMTFERYRECGKPAELHVLSESAADLITQIKMGLQPRSVETLRLLLIEVEREEGSVSVDECPFTGDVEVTAHGEMGPSVQLTWTCPTCGHQHEEDGE
jgi:hypothetical protein